MVGEAPALQLALRWRGAHAGAARIMIELRNKHTLTGKLCCFQIVLCAQLGGDFLAKA